MASDLELGNHCLVWNTNRPLLDSTRKSSSFWLLGFEWKLQLRLHARGDYFFEINLHRVSHDKHWLHEDLKIVTFVLGRDSRNGIHETTTLNKINSRIVLWSHEKSYVDDQIGTGEIYGKWRITFAFYCNRPLVLKLSPNEPTFAFPQAFENPQPSSTPFTSVFSRNIFSDDKSVQVSLDIPPDLENLSQDYRQLLEQEIFPDVKLRCGDRSISAHRSILAARSEVFKAMFRNKMAESETGTVDVTDMDSEVLDLLMQYVYSGKVSDLSEDSASSLYAAGNKYSIHTLKNACSDWLVKNLTAGNCIDYLMLAEIHTDESFMNRVTDFIAENMELIEKDAWSEFCRDHPALAVCAYQRRFPTHSKQQ